MWGRWGFIRASVIGCLGTGKLVLVSDGPSGAEHHVWSCCSYLDELCKEAGR